MYDPASSTLLYPVEKDFRYDCTFVALRRPSSPNLAVLLLVAAAPFALTGSASAQQFKVTATGKITSVDNTAGLYNSSVAVGTSFVETYLFDYSAHDTFSNSVSSGRFDLSGPYFGPTITYGDYKFTPRPGAGTLNIFYVGDQPIGIGTDELSLESNSSTAFGFTAPATGGETLLDLLDTTGSLLSSKALPPLSTYGAYDLSGLHGLASFRSKVYTNDNNAGPTSSIYGTVTSLSAELVNPAAVPEASTWVSLGMMLGLGGLGLAARRWRVIGA